MYSVDAESNSSSIGSLTTGTVCGSRHLPISSTASLVTFRLSRVNLPTFHGTENVANTFDDDEYLFTSVYKKLTFIRLDEDGTACTPNCTTCEQNGPVIGCRLDDRPWRCDHQRRGNGWRDNISYYE